MKMLRHVGVTLAAVLLPALVLVLVSRAAAAETTAARAETPAAARAPAPAPVPVPDTYPRGPFRIGLGSWSDTALMAEFEASVGESVPIEGTALTIIPLRYVPDFAVSFESRTVVSRSDSPVNPALRILYFDEEGFRDRIWLFQNRPNFRQRERLSYRFVFLGLVGETGVDPSSIGNR